MKNVRVYDNGGETFDRYTAVFLDCKCPEMYDEGPMFDCLGMSEDPFHPQGFGCHSSAQLGPHLGRRIAFDKLPAKCQEAVRQSRTSTK